MKLDEYLNTVSEQIRYAKIRPTVTEELKNHILDQAETYETHGAFPEEALERAIREMGDPVETGVSLDRIHRPQMNWTLVITIGILSLFSVGMMYITNWKVPDTFPWQNQLLYSLIGFASMLIVCRLDYSILGTLGWKGAIGYLALIILAFFFIGKEFSGSIRYIDLGFFNVSIAELMLLYIPLFAAVLYNFRGDGAIVFLKIIPPILIPCMFLFRLPDLGGSVLLFSCLFCLFLFTGWKDWYQINRKWTCGIGMSLLALFPAFIMGFFYFFGADYQKARIEAFLTRAGNFGYIPDNARTILESSALLGSSDQAVDLFVNGPTTDYVTDYIFVSMCSIYGILLTMAIIAGIVLLIFKIFRISTEQKNQLGMAVGVGCGLVFFTKTAASILVNLQLLPYLSISMPFLSYGGSNVVMSYILLGLVLSIYRYKNVLPKKTHKKYSLKLVVSSQDHN